MQTIEKEMIEAIKAKKNWSKNNTSTHYNEHESLTIVRLHSSIIAEIRYTDEITLLKVTNAGYKTNVTRNRLNVLINEFGLLVSGIHQKNYKWYITYTDETTEEMKNNFLYSA